MKKFAVCLVITLISVVLNGCDQASLMKKMTPQEDKAIATNYIELLRQGKFDQIEKDLDPSIRSSDIRETLSKMANLIPATNPESVKVVGSQITSGPSWRTANITFEYQFSEKWLLINVATQKKNEASTIVGFNVNPIPDSLERINKFTLTGKGLTHYMTLSLIVLIALFTVYALVLCIKTKPLKRKWLWVIFILFGIGKFGMNWTTGQYFAAPVSIQLFSASAFAPTYGPWTLSVSFPLGAAIFLAVRKRLGKTKELTNGCTGSEQTPAPPGEP